MAKRSLRDWAAIAEIIGTVMVIVSLLFAVYSIQQNTDQLRVQNENYMFDKMHASLDTIVKDPSFAEIVLKVENQQKLSPSAQPRYTAYTFQRLNLWEMAYF